MTGTFDKSSFTNRKQTKQSDNRKIVIKSSITQRFWTDFGVSVGVDITTNLVWLSNERDPNLPNPRNICIIQRDSNIMITTLNH